jgi:solute carrier family 35 protein F1/2
MESKNLASKVTGVETYETHLGDKSSEGLDGNGNGSGSLEMTGQRGVTATDEEVDPEILEHALQALENKKTAWWAYLTTRDFWLVLLIG